MERETIRLKLTKPGNLPYVLLFHNKDPFLFVIDTGSTLSWTRVDVASKFIMGKESGFEKIVANGESIPMVTATLRKDPSTGTPDDYTATKFRARFACGEGTQKIKEMNEVLETEIHGILGSDFLVDNGLKIDLANFRLVV